MQLLLAWGGGDQCALEESCRWSTTSHAKRPGAAWLNSGLTTPCKLQVEALLAHEKEPENFMEAPALAPAVKALAEDGMKPLTQNQEL